MRRVRIALVATMVAAGLYVGLTSILNRQAGQDLPREARANEPAPLTPDSACITTPGGLADEMVLHGLAKPTDSLASRYVITNCAHDEVHTEHDFCDSQRTLVASVSDRIRASGWQTYDLDEIHVIPTGYTGYVLIRSDHPVTGVVLPTPSPSPTPTPSPVPSPTPEMPPPIYLPLVTRLLRPTAPLRVGDSVRFRSWSREMPLEGVVTHSEFRSVLYREDDDPVEAGGVFVVALLDVTNHGLESGEVGRHEVRLKDSARRKFDMAELEALWAAEEEYDRESVYAAIQPGFTEPLVFVFDVLPESQGLHLISSTSW